MTATQQTTTLGVLGALRLAASARAHTLSGLALNLLPRDRDLDRVSDDLTFAAQDETRPAHDDASHSPAAAARRLPVNPGLRGVLPG